MSGNNTCELAKRGVLRALHGYNRRHLNLRGRLRRHINGLRSGFGRHLQWNLLRNNNLLLSLLVLVLNNRHRSFRRRRNGPQQPCGLGLLNRDRILERALLNFSVGALQQVLQQLNGALLRGRALCTQLRDRGNCVSHESLRLNRTLDHLHQCV